MKILFFQQRAVDMPGNKKVRFKEPDFNVVLIGGY